MPFSVRSHSASNGREHHAVVQLHGVEVAVGHRAQAFARAAIGGGQGLGEGAVVMVLGDVAERGGQAGLTVHHRLHVLDAPVLHPEAHGVIGGRAVLLHQPEPGRLTGGRVGRLQALGRGAADRAPQAGADRHGHVVLGEHHILGEAGARGVVARERVHIGVQLADQAGAVAGHGWIGARVAGRLGVGGRRPGQESQGQRGQDDARGSPHIPSPRPLARASLSIEGYSSTRRPG